MEVTTPGFSLESFQLQETGDYQLSGADASATVSGMLAVTSLTTLDGFQPFRDEQLFSAGDLNVKGSLTQWGASASSDLTGIAGWGSDTEVRVTLENLLTATTLANGEQAFVEKKFEGIALTVNPVPVPAAIWLFGAGLVSLIGFARRR